MRYISADDLRALAKHMIKTGYGQYLIEYADTGSNSGNSANAISRVMLIKPKMCGNVRGYLVEI